MSRRSNDFALSPFTIWRPSHYSGQTVLGVTATQLEGTGLGPAERKRVFAEWLEFFGSAATSIRELQLVSRVPQELIDSLAGQTQLEALLVKWGPYRDVNALGGLTGLRTLRLGGATGLAGVEPLLRLPVLTSLAVIQTHKTDATPVLAQLSSLTSLTYGNDHPGDDRNVVVPDLEWLRSLHNLRTLALPGIRLANPDLAPILELKQLDRLLLPLRRDLRAQVFSFARESVVFESVAENYRKYESWSSKH